MLGIRGAQNGDAADGARPSVMPKPTHRLRATTHRSPAHAPMSGRRPHGVRVLVGVLVFLTVGVGVRVTFGTRVGVGIGATKW